MSDISEPNQRTPSPVLILLFDKLPRLNGAALAAGISGIEPLNGNVAIDLEAESKDGFVAYASFDAHRVQLVGISAPVPDDVIRHTIPCSQFKPDVTKPMLKHRAQVVCCYHGASPDPAERLVALHKIARGFLQKGLLGYLDPEAWNCMPRTVVEKITPLMLRSCMLQAPLSFWVGFIKIFKEQLAVWFCTKGQHRFGLKDFAYLGVLNEAQEANDRFNRLFCYLREWSVTPQPGDTAQLSPNEYVRFRDVYEFGEFLNGAAGTLVIEKTSEAEARTGGPAGSGTLLQVHEQAVLIDEKDPAMAAAIAYARDSLPHFWQAFERRENGENGFCLKVGISDSTCRESFWATGIERKDGQIFGTIDNEPNFVRNVRSGQRIVIPEADIVDWFYSRAGKMVGNFTLRILAGNLPPEQADVYLRKLSDLVPIKVQCTCGQKYAFEVEAAGGRMPWPVNCPSCGADGTATANEILRQIFPTQTNIAPRLSLPSVAKPHGSTASMPPPTVPSPSVEQRPVVRTTASEAITSLVCAALIIPLAFVGMFVHFPLTWLSAIPGILAGHSALSSIRADRRLKGTVIAIIGLAFCYLNVAALSARVVFHFASGEKGWGQIASRSTPVRPNFMPAQSPVWARSVRNDRPASTRPATPSESKVVADPLKVEIAAAPVAGTLSGRDFTCDKAVVQSGLLILSHGLGPIPLARLQLPIQLKWGESIAGKRILISSQATVPPGIILNWHEPGKSGSDILARNYVLRLEFGEPARGKIPGKIYLESSPSHKTKIEGSFEADMK